MSIAFRHVTFVFFAVAAACGSGAGGDSGYDPERYRGMAQKALEDGVVVYWLGPKFAAGGLTFDQIDPSSSESDDGRVTSVNFHYSSEEVELPDGTDLVREKDGTVDVRSFRADRVENAVRLPNRAQFYDVVEKDVTVNGSPAELVTLWLGPEGPNSMLLIMPHDQGAVTLSTSAFLSAGEGIQINPVMDEEVFLRAAENLRPYDGE